MSTATPTTSVDTVIDLRDVSWQTYETLRNNDLNHHVRMTFDQGRLYLMSPSRLHERIAELLGRFVNAWTEEKVIPILSAGSTTMRDKIRDCGLEPDKCYYIKNEAVVRRRDVFEFGTDPPPDLAIEVDVTSMSTVRMTIYARFGVPEIWRWIDDQIEVYHLDGDTYVRTDRSSSLFDFPFEMVIELLSQRHDVDETSLLATFRKSI